MLAFVPGAQRCTLESGLEHHTVLVVTAVCALGIKKFHLSVPDEEVKERATLNLYLCIHL